MSDIPDAVSLEVLKPNGPHSKTISFGELGPFASDGMKSQMVADPDAVDAFQFWAGLGTVTVGLDKEGDQALCAERQLAYGRVTVPERPPGFQREHMGGLVFKRPPVHIALNATEVERRLQAKGVDDADVAARARLLNRAVRSGLQQANGVANSSTIRAGITFSIESLIGHEAVSAAEAQGWRAGLGDACKWRVGMLFANQFFGILGALGREFYLDSSVDKIMDGFKADYRHSLFLGANPDRWAMASLCAWTNKFVRVKPSEADA